MVHLKGKHIYPAIIALNTQIGIKEIDAIRQSHDHDEIGHFNPSVRTLTSFSAENQIIPTLKSNGVLYVQTCPSGGRISGKSSVMKLNGWNWEDAAIVKEDGMHINWPQRYHYWNHHWSSGRGKVNKKHSGEVDRLYNYLDIK